MSKEHRHLVFYDGKCGFCDLVVQWLLSIDRQEIFVFAPLQGKTAKLYLKEFMDEDSIVLIENYQSKNSRYLILGKAAFRILWLLGGAWSIIGAISFLPSFLYDWGYRLVARNRGKLFSQHACVVPNPSMKKRFLD